MGCCWPHQHDRRGRAALGGRQWHRILGCCVLSLAAGSLSCCRRHGSWFQVDTERVYGHVQEGWRPALAALERTLSRPDIKDVQRSSIAACIPSILVDSTMPLASAAAFASAATLATAAALASAAAMATAVAFANCSRVCEAQRSPPRPPPPWLLPRLALASAAALAISDARSSRGPRRTFARPRLPPSPEPLPRRAFGAVASSQPPSSSHLRATRRRRREDVGGAIRGNTAGWCSAAKRRRTHLSADRGRS